MTKEKLDHIIGNTAATLTTGAFIPGAVAVLKMFPKPLGSAISLLMYIALNVGVAGWIWYGRRTKSQPVILANMVTIVFTMTILVYKIIYG